MTCQQDGAGIPASVEKWSCKRSVFGGALVTAPCSKVMGGAVRKGDWCQTIRSTKCQIQVLPSVQYLPYMAHWTVVEKWWNFQEPSLSTGFAIQNFPLFLMHTVHSPFVWSERELGEVLLTQQQEESQWKKSVHDYWRIGFCFDQTVGISYLASFFFNKKIFKWKLGEVKKGNSVSLHRNEGMGKRWPPIAGPYMLSELVELFQWNMDLDPWQEWAGNPVPTCRMISDRRQVLGSKNWRAEAPG